DPARRNAVAEPTCSPGCDSCRRLAGDRRRPLESSLRCAARTQFAPRSSGITMSQRVFNFSPGPAVLPLEVLEEVQRDLLALPGLGVSALEIGHRTPWFEGVVAETKANLRKLLNLPDGYSTIFLQGGSRLQF